MIRNRFVLLLCAFSMLLIQAQVNGQTSELSVHIESLWVRGGQHRLFGQAFSRMDINSEPILVVSLHGDAPPPYENPSYQYVFASKVAAANKDVIAVGLLRPGYTDLRGNHSEGERGQLNGDNWNARNTDTIAEAISNLKSQYHARIVVVAGHSGGAAITANILGRHPGLVGAALLVSCPCGHVEDWRKNMLELTGISVFQGNIDTLSPIEQVDYISDKVIISLMVGTQDKVTPAKFSEKFVSELSSQGKNAKLVRLEGSPHNIFLNPTILAEVGVLIERLNLEGNRNN